MIEPQQMPIAVVGMAAMFPGAKNLGEYRDNLFGGVDAITDAPGSRWDPALYHPEAANEPASSDRFYCRRGGFIDDSPEVSVARFGIMPNSVEGTEPDQLIALELAAAALADAGLSGELLDGVDRSRIGVVLGRGGYIAPGASRLSQRVSTAGQLATTLGQLLPELGPEVLERVRSAFIDQLGPDRPDNAIGLVPNLAASRVANRLDLRGPAYTLDAACASSLLAVDHAIRELQSQRCDLMLAGGVHHAHDATLWSVFTQLKALSAAQLSRPFDANSDGILIGEGTGVLALKRFADAVRDGDRIYATIRGSGVASDGRTSSLMNPDPGGQSRAIRAAWNRAGLDPRQGGSVGLIEAHGTGTPAGDASELSTLREVFGPTDPEGPKAGIGSVKSMIGHAMPAAGAAGLIKAALAVYHGVLPPTLGISEAHPALAGTRFEPVTHAAEWSSDPRQPLRRAGVNAFGFGGINAHVLLEQVPGQAAVPISIGEVLFDADRQAVQISATSPVQSAAAHSPSVAETGGASGANGYLPEPEAAPVLLLAAESVEALERRLTASDEELLGAVGSAPGEGPVRVGIVSPTAKKLSIARKAVSRGKAWHGRSDIWFRPEPLLASATTDSDDGSGKRGSLAFVCPGLEAEFSPRIDDVISYFTLPGIRGAAAEGEVTENAHLQGSAVLQVSRTLAAALGELGVAPDALAGHSVGEWSAMVLGGMYDAAAVDSFLEDSGMAQTVFPGLAFAVIGAPHTAVLAELAPYPDTVLSHDNAPQQSMICGPLETVEILVERFREQGYVSRVLPFASGFHTPMFREFLSQLDNLTGNLTAAPAKIPVWSANTAQLFSPHPEEIQRTFINHLLEHVRFRELVQNMHADGVRVFVQMGPGQLGSLITDTLQGQEHLVVSANASQNRGLDQLRTVLTALWASGRDVDLEFLGVAPALVAAALDTQHGSRSTSQENSQAQQLNASSALASTEIVSGPRSRLDLSTPVILLDPEQAKGILQLNRVSLNRVNSGSSDRADSSTASPRSFATGTLSPAVASELEAFLGETEALVTSVLQASASLPAPLDPNGPLDPSGLVPPPSWASGAAAMSDGGTPLPQLMPEIPSRRIEISLEAMPHLADHSFFRQRDDWPEAIDRFPVMPGTTIIRLMMDFAEESTGARAIAVHSVRFNQWVDLSETSEAVLTARWIDETRLAVSFGNFSHCTVELGAEYGSSTAEIWRVDPALEEAPTVKDASEIYTEHWMFHGPQYQGIIGVHGVSDSHIRGTILAKAAKGSLMDNIGQLAGYWLMSRFEERATVFPAGMQTLRFFGPDPAPGESVECLMRVTEVNDTFFQADGQLLHNGTVWCEIIGWQDRRFDSAPNIRQMDQAIEHHAFAHPQPGGWVLMPDYWPDLASRDLTMRKYLGRAERLEHQGSPPRGRRQRLLGKIAAKDAVRLQIWRSEPDRPIFPAEVGIGHLDSGQPFVAGVHGASLPELAVSIAHSHDIGVAIAAPGPEHPVGIDIESIEERTGSLEAVVFGEAEQGLLDRLRAAAGADVFEARAWFTRFWSAKEAVGKALGTGLAGRPRQIEVVAVSQGGDDSDYRLDVEVGQCRYAVQVKTIQNPEKLPDRSYVVAWTLGGPLPDRQNSKTPDLDPEISDPTVS
ncbi:beta-ketoacyl synthase N-terminal-like domain-containing protein [Psychromicrobium sp. YIM B11713]|uniref:type I polyketide synthase n=1 Tax=Psychromicrobium sp. YIM B11713 TaxID=3145233 RepID=UPI00374EEAC6